MEDTPNRVSRRKPGYQLRGITGLVGECCPGSQGSSVVCDMVRAVCWEAARRPYRQSYVVSAGHEAGVLKVSVVLTRTVRVPGADGSIWSTRWTLHLSLLPILLLFLLSSYIVSFMAFTNTAPYITVCFRNIFRFLYMYE